jgi:zinc/manganese transport system substrate-binding protein
MKYIYLFLILITLSAFNYAKVKVVASTTVIYDLVKQIGKDKVNVDYIARGDQDPHFVEVLPSYMLKLRNADIFFRIGMGLEMWSNQLIDGSRNSKLKVIDLSSDINKKEVPNFKPDASYGDVHPYGNPHYWLDPDNAKIMANEILEALSAESSGDAAYFKSNYDDFISKLDRKITEWDAKMAGHKGKPFIFFHASWIYFADHFGIKIAGYIEPKPGITPTPGHNAELIGLIKSKGIKYIVMDNFYSDSAPNQVAAATGAKVVKVPTAVFGVNGINSYFDLIDYIVNHIAGTA